MYTLKQERHLIVLMGATASGKSAAAYYLAKAFGTEIISADARKCYQGMEIGTHAPAQVEQAAVKHHFVGTHLPSQPLSAGVYAQDCHKLLNARFQKHSVLLLVGGSGMYVRAVCDGLSPIADIPIAIRNKWRHMCASGKLSELQAFVATHDPTYYAQVDAQNGQRLARAAEVIESTGQPYSLQRKKYNLTHLFRIHKLGLLLPRKQLYARIEARCQHMLAAGLWQEVTNMHTQWGKNLPPTIGYTELVAHLNGTCSKVDAEKLFVQNKPKIR